MVKWIFSIIAFTFIAGSGITLASIELTPEGRLLPAKINRLFQIGHALQSISPYRSNYFEGLEKNHPEIFHAFGELILQTAEKMKRAKGIISAQEANHLSSQLEALKGSKLGARFIGNLHGVTLGDEAWISDRFTVGRREVRTSLYELEILLSALSGPNRGPLIPMDGDTLVTTLAGQAETRMAGRKTDPMRDREDYLARLRRLTSHSGLEQNGLTAQPPKARGGRTVH